MNRRTVAVAAVVTMLLVPGVALAGVTGSPDIDAFAPDNRLEPGAETALTVQFTNSGSSRRVSFRPGGDDPEANAQLEPRVKTAQNLRAELRSGNAPIDVETGQIPLGTLQDGGVREAQFRITVDEDADPGTYRLPIDIEYTHPEDIDYLGEVLDSDDVSEEEYVEVRITDGARFEIVNVSTTAQVGGSGPIELTMENTGSATASDSTVSLQSMTGDVVFGGSNSASQYVGSWEQDEQRTVRFQATVSPDAITEPYALRATVGFDNSDGAQVESQPLSTGIVPRAEQAFSLDADESTLQVGREGNLSGTITNEGPATAHDAVVVFTPTSPNTNVQESEFALGTLDSGESAEFSLPIEISQNGEPGQRQFSFRVEYQNEDDERRESEPLNTMRTIQPQQPLFDVQLEDERLNASETRVVTLLVTNNGDQVFRNVDAQAFANSPLSLPTEEAYARQIAPGETAELRLELGAGANAIPRTYSFSVDFQYDTPNGETRLSDTYSVPVDVAEAPERGGLPLGLIGAAVVVVALIAAALWYRNRS